MYKFILAITVVLSGCAAPNYVCKPITQPIWYCVCKDGSFEGNVSLAGCKCIIEDVHTNTNNYACYVPTED